MSVKTLINLSEFSEPIDNWCFDELTEIVIYWS